MSNYKNLKAVIYAPVMNLLDIDNFDNFAKEWDWLTSHVGVDKIYLETYRHGTLIEKNKMEEFIDFFKSRGVEVSGGITTDGPNDGEGGFDPLCYTNPKTEELMKKVVRLTASLFDELMLDDFYFTNCRCELCIDAKGDKTWSEFRTELMQNFSRDVVIKTAKEVNPKCKTIIKYPNWYESFQETGYNTKDQPEIFDYVYTGTETRNPQYTQQHLPKYLSYFNMRYIESLAPSRNVGGWFDPYECTYNLTSYKEQIELTLLGKAKESLAFCLGSLLDSDYRLCSPIMGQVYRDMDKYLGQLGNPVGTLTYMPHHCHGEDNIHNFIGMLGVPLEPVCEYPDNADTLFLAQNASMDPDIVEKVEKSLRNGSNVIITSGFLNKVNKMGFKKIVNIEVTKSRALINSYLYSSDGITIGGCVESAKSILIPRIMHMNNDTWDWISGLGEDTGFPLLIKTLYGKGRLYVLTTPDDLGDFYHYPREILKIIRNILSPKLPATLDAVSKMGYFVYDNNVIVLHSFRANYDQAIIEVEGENAKLLDLVNNKTLTGSNFNGKTLFKFRVSPGINKVFKVEN